MPHGLQVFTPEGAAQIDGENQNWVLREKGSSTTATSFNGYSRYRQLSITASLPVVAVRCPTRWCYSRISNVGGDSWSVWVQTQSNTVTDFDYWVFDKASEVSVENEVGLEVFDSAGGVVYNSEHKLLRIADIYQTEDYVSEGYESLSVELDDTKTFAMVIMNPAQYKRWIPLGGGIYSYTDYALGIRIDDEEMDFGRTYLANSDNGPYGGVPSGAQHDINFGMMLIDVTGY